MQTVELTAAEPAQLALPFAPARPGRRRRLSCAEWERREANLRSALAAVRALGDGRAIARVQRDLEANERDRPPRVRRGGSW